MSRTPFGRLGASLALLGVLMIIVAGCSGASGVLPAASSGGSDARQRVGFGQSDNEAGAPGGEVPAEEGGEEAPAGEPGSAPGALLDQALVVKTGSLELEVSDLSPSLLKARTAIVGLGGYVSASEQTTGDTRQVASVTYRIPAERWDEALDALKKLGTKLLGEQTQAVDVSTQVVDLDARIANLRAAEQQLQGIMARAEKISDVLEIQGQLTQVRGQIEQYTAQRDHLQDQASYGTLAVSYEVPVAPIAEVRSGWNLQAEVDRATAQLVQLGQGLATIGIFFAIVLLPILVVGALGLAFVLFVIRRLGIDRRRLAPPAEGTAPGA